MKTACETTKAPRLILPDGTAVTLHFFGDGPTLRHCLEQLLTARRQGRP